MDLIIWIGIGVVLIVARIIIGRERKKDTWRSKENDLFI